MRALSSSARRDGLTLVELMMAMTVTGIILMALVAVTEVVTANWRDAEQTSLANQQARVAVTRLRHDIAASLYAGQPAGADDTLVLWAHDNDLPAGYANISEMVVVSPVTTADGSWRVARISQAPSDSYNFWYAPADLPAVFADASFVDTLKTWSFAERSVLVEDVPVAVPATWFAVRRRRNGTRENAVDLVVDFCGRVSMRGKWNNTARSPLAVRGTVRLRNFAYEMFASGSGG